MSPARTVDDNVADPSIQEENQADNPPSEDGEVNRSALETPKSDASSSPPLPLEAVPPLPDEAPPQAEDDGWDPIWDDNAQAFYFYNRFTHVSQWTNPRVPDTTPQPGFPGVANHDRIAAPAQAPGAEHAPGTEPPPDQQQQPPQKPPPAEYIGYNPAIHGDYDPSAPYAKPQQQQQQPSTSLSPPLVDPTADPSSSSSADPAAIYTATGTFNRFTGKWQAHDINPENHNDENKSRRQMSAFFDVDAAANSHNGRSLKAERSGKKLSKQELKAFKEKRKERKEEKRRAWLRD